MVLDKQRARMDWWLVPLAKYMRYINPNVVTWLSLVCSIGAGYAFWQSGPDRVWMLGVAGALVWSNGILDVLDGKIAKITDNCTPKGDYLDHAIDRFSDVAFLSGLAFSPWVRLDIGLAAIVFTLLTSYLGTQAQAVGIGRNYGGFLGRADRMAMLIIVPLVQWLFTSNNWRLPWEKYSPNLLETMMIYFAVMGFITTIQRFWGGLKAFDSDGGLKE
jgi:phosphatidylglycerophosphate synthase